MDLFNKKLSLADALHYNSIIDGNGFDNDLLMVYNGLNTPMWTPDMPSPETKILNNQQNTQNTQIFDKQQTPSVQIATIKENKNNTRQYIKLPNATITKHIHKYRGSKTKRFDE